MTATVPSGVGNLHFPFDYDHEKNGVRLGEVLVGLLERSGFVSPTGDPIPIDFTALPPGYAMLVGTSPDYPQMLFAAPEGGKIYECKDSAFSDAIVLGRCKAPTTVEEAAALRGKVRHFLMDIFEKLSIENRE